MRVLKNQLKTPIGGWRFVDPKTGFRFQLPYRSLKELMDHVRKYRKDNGLPEIKKLPLVIQDWICSHPGMEHQCKDFEMASKSRTIGQYKQGAQAYAEALLTKEKERYVPQEVSEKRAAICANCWHNPTKEELKQENNKAWLEKFTDKKMLELTEGRTTSKDEDLFYCRICTCPLRAKVHFARNIIENSLELREKLQMPNGSLGRDGKPVVCWQIRIHDFEWRHLKEKEEEKNAKE